MKLEELAKLLMNKDAWVHKDEIVYSTSPSYRGNIHVGHIMRISRLKGSKESIHFTMSIKQLNKTRLSQKDCEIKLYLHQLKITNAWVTPVTLEQLIDKYAYDKSAFIFDKVTAQNLFNKALDKRYSFDFCKNKTGLKPLKNFKPKKVDVKILHTP